MPKEGRLFWIFPVVKGKDTIYLKKEHWTNKYFGWTLPGIVRFYKLFNKKGVPVYFKSVDK